MRREFLINVIFLFAVNLLIKPFYIFGIDRTVQNEVGPENFGMYWALFNFVYLFQVLNDLGIQNFTNTYISQNRHRAQKYLGHIGALKIVASVAFIGVVILASFVFGYQDEWSNYLWILVINQVLVSIIFFLRGNLAGMGFYRWDSFMSVLDKALMIVICGSLFWVVQDYPFTIITFVYAQLASLAVSCLLLIVVNLIKTDGLRLNWHVPTMLIMLRKSAPFALTFILTVIYTRVDSVMIERLLDEGALESGVYVSGFRLLEASNMLIYLFIGLLLPMLAYLHNNRKEGQALFWMGFKIVFVVSIVIGIILSLYALPVMDLLYENATPYWSKVAAFLMLGFIGMALAHIAGAALLANGMVGQCNWVYGSGMLLNIILNSILIPQHHALGAAIATLFTQFAVALMSMLLIWYRLKFTIKGTTVTTLIGYGVVVTGITWWVSTHSLFRMWYVDALFLGLFFAVLAMLTGLLPLKQLIKRRKEHQIHASN